MPVPCPHCLRPIPEGASSCARCAGPPDAPVPFPDASGGPPPPLPDRYRIRRFLGRGGMGRVYLCEDADLEVEVAVKVLPADLASDEAAMGALAREARLAARLRGHPGILQLYGFERHAGNALLVMEYAPGGSLLTRLREAGPLEEEECRRLGASIADSLAFAHERRVLHRDIKPANVLLAGDGTPRVADFGLARVLATTSSASTIAGCAGTPSYMPPEVIDRRPPDERSDLYSLGCVLYEMAAGEPPFLGTFAEVALQKSRPGGRVPDPREARPGISADYAAAARRLMEREPADRFADARTVARVLRGEAVERTRSPSAGRSLLLQDLPVEPAVRGLPLPPAPAGPPPDLPAGFLRQGGRTWCLGDGSEMVLVPAGPFLMGSDRDAPDEGPARQVHLSPFLVDRHEVTIWQFRRYCEAVKRPLPDQPPGANDRHPVVNVTWEEAREYAAWAGKCLPTEAQWEKAARGTDGRAFPWGNAPPGDDEARYQDPGEDGPASAGSFPAGMSPCGCLDMVGNAWEWVADWYAADYYRTGPSRDPIGPVEGTSRVLRGGAWNDPRERLRVTKRRRSQPGSRFGFVGFRCVKDLPAG
ncbi:MAG: bifunctional serine/threonine-protein kinase/formylglycine-generating enzyme family protein [Planctomycetes bacterium]|nr:bifunctional serine/threonine-protein kinase/formylglycine-generating enzyme family protein [Planctomycetota bacterium]